MREICGVWCEIRVDARCDDDGEACFRLAHHSCMSMLLSYRFSSFCLMESWITM
jgi:hypothetical protein